MALTGKIRVVENIGYDSKTTFGKVGQELLVEDGSFFDIEDFCWYKENSEKFNSIEEINEYFGEQDLFQTKFELVED